MAVPDNSTQRSEHVAIYHRIDVIGDRETSLPDMYTGNLWKSQSMNFCNPLYILLIFSGLKGIELKF